ncbi:MAG: NAD-dependent dihydropyrimidine dehydrogenase subunit PreA [Firmicutes bacterium]|nr:NAD-dependent dihydropyrimidine dehydrogenase subunit PreA [Bacillota bacterium]
MGVDLGIEFCGVKFPNPYVLAAAPPTDNPDMIRRGFQAGWGGAIIKTLSVKSEPVSLVYPMMAGIPHKGQTSMGLKNIDLISEHKVDEWLPEITKIKKEFPNNVLIASIMASKKEDWQDLVTRLEEAGVDMIECSFSCPHGMPDRGMGSAVGQNAELTERTARWVKEAAKRVPVIIKLTPQVTDITVIAKAVQDSGADGVCAINTVKGLLGFNLDTWVPYPEVDGYSTYGGYSGPAIKPVALKCVAEIASKVGIPITAVGGLWDWRDAVEFLLAGAQTVQSCTAAMAMGFRIIDDLCEGLSNYLESKGLSSVQELVGKGLPQIKQHAELNRDYHVRAFVDQETCVKCDVCHIACYDGGHQAIEIGENRTVTVNTEKCVGCGFCPTVCPVGALSIKKFLPQEKVYA